VTIELMKPMRTDDRKRVLMKASVIDFAGAQAVRVKDLTSSGAKVAVERMLYADSDVIFERGTLFVAARVAWSGRDEAGLEFYRTLPLSAVGAAFHPVVEIETE
jgi:hypothetical protein